MIITIPFKMHTEYRLIPKIILLSNNLCLIRRKTAHLHIQMIDILIAMQEFDKNR